MADLKIDLLGPPEILLKGKPIETERRKAIALLAYLAVTGQPQPRDHLAAFFWPDYDRKSAFAYLRRELYEINSLLGKGWLVQDGRRPVGLEDSSRLMVDVHQFAAALESARDAEDPVSQLEQAAAQYRGDFLAGFFLQDTEPFEDWQREQTEYYRREYAGALERLAALHEQRGAWEQSLHWARTWLSLDDLNEAAHRALMRIFAGMGDRAAAVRQYRICQTELEEELGVEPQAETTGLYERIVQDRFDRPEPALPSSGPDAAGAAYGNAHLPVLTTPFIGRRPELEQVKELVIRPENRLVTLFGPGGTGKTRLSIQAASELGGYFEHGIWFVPLAATESSGEIVQAIAKSLNFAFHREEEPPRQQLLEYLHQKNLLLILDNVEHLVSPEAAALWMDILTGSEQVKILTTTRVRLNLPGEQLFAVTGMRLPEPEEAADWSDPPVQSKPYSAVQLFIDRAVRVHPGFRLSRENAAAVAEICQLVDGLPLGIELAASWLELLPPEEVAGEIRRSMDFLETDRPNVPARQRSIRAVFDYSWKLLNEIEREAFLKLCVFAGSFSSEAGRRVSGASLRTLLSLSNKTWLQHGEDGRFQLHPLLLHYGQERLRADADLLNAARDAHVAYFVDFIAGLSEQMRGADQLKAFNEFAREFNTNIKITWNRLVEIKSWSDLVEKVIPALYHFGEIRWRGIDLIEWFRALRLAADLDEEGVERRAFVIAGILEAYFEESWSLKENQPVERLELLWQIVEERSLSNELGFWFCLLANLIYARSPSPKIDRQLDEAMQRLYDEGDSWSYAVAVTLRMNNWDGLAVERSEDRIRQALAIFQGLGAAYEQAAIKSFLALNASAANRPLEEVLVLYGEAEQHYRTLKDMFGLGIIHWHLAGLYFSRGLPEAGFQEYREMRRVFMELGNHKMVGMSLSWEGLWAGRYKSPEEAIEIRSQVLSLTRKHGLPSDVFWNTYELGDLYRISGKFVRAVELVREAREMFERFNMLMGLGYCERTAGDIAMVEGRYEMALHHFEAFHDYVVRDNHRWSSLQALGKIASAEAALGDVQQSRRNLRICLEQLGESINHDLELMALLAEVRCRMVEGRLKPAVSLAAVVADHPISWNEVRAQAQAFLDELAEKLSAQEYEAAAAVYREVKLEELLTSLLAELADVS